jgi:hypothetical protein
MDRDNLARTMAQRRPLFGPPLLRPLQGGERRANPEGSYSTEITMTDQDPQGRWMVYPSLWMGPQGPVELPRRAALRAADLYEQFGYQFPRFGDLAASERFAVERSRRGGTGVSPLARRR